MKLRGLKIGMRLFVGLLIKMSEKYWNCHWDFKI